MASTIAKEDPRAAKMASLVTAIYQKRYDEDYTGTESFTHPQAVFNYDSLSRRRRTAQGSRDIVEDILKDYGDPQRGTWKSNALGVPIHCKRGKRQCLVCYAINYVNTKPHVVFECPLIYYLVGFPTPPVWVKSLEEIFQDTYWWREYLDTVPDLQ